jgi:hypothetical protein
MNEEKQEPHKECSEWEMDQEERHYKNGHLPRYLRGIQAAFSQTKMMGHDG